MNLKNFDKANKIYQQIKALDAEIIEIEKMAGLIADGGKCQFDFSCESKSGDKKVSVLDSDGSLIDPNNPNKGYSVTFMLWGGSGETKKVENPNLHRMNKCVSESIALQLMGVLIAEKVSARNELVQKLESIKVH